MIKCVLKYVLKYVNIIIGLSHVIQIQLNSVTKYLNCNL